jgi:hypothetical protein
MSGHQPLGSGNSPPTVTSLIVRLGNFRETIRQPHLARTGLP